MIVIIETTTDEMKNAEILSKLLIDKKLSPCIQISREIKSFYNWKGKIDSSDEFLVKIKTIQNNCSKITELIKKNSNYEIPEIIMYEGEILSNEYSTWFHENINNNN